MSDVAIETERLLLRRYRMTDLPHYIAMNGDPEVMRYLGGPMAAPDAARQMADIADSFERSGFGKIAVERRADGAFLGFCGLSVEPWYPDELEIGWRMLPQVWGQGYATEAAIAWRDFAFEMLVAPRIISIADVPNVRSHRVMERLGMRLDHTRDLTDGDERFRAHIYALTAAEWREMARN